MNFPDVEREARETRTGDNYSVVNQRDGARRDDDAGHYHALKCKLHAGLSS